MTDLLTEDEAKAKWCPLAGTPRFTHQSEECVGSACMAWRAGVWDHQRNLKPEDRTPGVGYCGAFGRALV
jgi:hypothetical protein